MQTRRDRCRAGAGRRRTRLSAIFACAGAVLATAAAAAGRVSLEVGSLEFAGLEVDGLQADWTPVGAAGGAVMIRAARVRGIAATGPLAGFAFDCPELRVSGDTLDCERGRLSGSLGSLGAQDTRVRAHLATDGALRMRLETLALAGGRAAADVRLEGPRWRIDANGTDLDLARLAVIARPWVGLPDGFSVAGEVSGTVAASGRDEALSDATLDLAWPRLDFGNAGGTLAGEAIAGRLRAGLRATASGFTVSDGRLELTGGQAYAEPLFLDFGRHAAALEVEGLLDPDGPRFDAGSFAIAHDGVLQASGSAVVDLGGAAFLPRARVRIAALNLAGALPAYAQPFLLDTAFKDVAGQGRVSGELAIDAGAPVRLALELEDVSAGSQAGSLSVEGLRGTLHWYDDATRSRLAGNIDDALFQSRLAWDSAAVWGLEIGAADLPFATSGRHFRLTEPRTLPVFDGGLAIGQLRVRHAGTEQMYVRFDAGIRPISVARLSRAFGWPEFSGTLAGTIPDLRLEGGVVTLGGNLEAQVFGGRVVVRDLRLREPLGRYPRLHASIEIDDLDLEQLTGTFSFGMITGRLSGRIADLETFDWMPVAFDARLATPPGDRSKHRISQRAVTNLSSIGGGSGGGVAAALQGGFLKFFDSFGYDRLGLSCRLENDVCTMNGVEPVDGGYYIVKGKGLPRIDVIGSQARVAWTRLVRQLAAITESGIVVE